MTWKRANRKAMIEHCLFVQRTLDRVPADLLLPAGLVPYAWRLKKNSGEWRNLIAYLVHRHRARVLQVAEKADNLRFQYQTEGLNLKRICYLPYRDVLAELRILSYASRISMCALIVLMLQWERAGDTSAELDSFIGVPIMMESGWRRTGAILTITAAIQMPADPRPPPA